MATTTNLDITEFVDGQNNPDTTINNALDVLDGMADVYIYDVSESSPASTDKVLATTGTRPYEWQHMVIQITDTASPQALAAGINVIVPTFTRVYLLANWTAQTVTMRSTPSPSAGIGVATGKSAFLRCDGTDVVRISADF